MSGLYFLYGDCSHDYELLTVFAGLLELSFGHGAVYFCFYIGESDSDSGRFFYVISIERVIRKLLGDLIKLIVSVNDRYLISLRALPPWNNAMVILFVRKLLDLG